MICPICKDDLLGRARCSSSYCEGYRDAMAKTEPREAARRRQGLREGFDLAANLFWRGVCEQRAADRLGTAAAMVLCFQRATALKWDAEDRVEATRQIERHRAEAAQLRKWASE